MKLYLWPLLVLSLSALAHEDFNRYQAENEHFRDFTREELSSRLGETKELLPQYECSQGHQWDPFWMPRTNAKKDSLTVQLKESQEIFIYREGQFLKANGKKLKRNQEPFFQDLKLALSKLEKVVETRKLLRSLEASPFPVTIKFGGNSFMPLLPDGTRWRGIYMANAIAIFDHGRFTSEQVFFYDIGIGGDVLWNPKTKDVPSEAVLAHELFHALDAVRGLLDMRFIQGDGYEFAFVSEHRAVYFENLTRKAAGAAYRTHYGQETTGPGVLDQQGQPRFVSAPCLK